MSSKREVMDSYYGRESEFVEEVLKPLFGNLGYEVVDNQGPQEFGKDLILKRTDPLKGTEVTVVVAKAVDVANTGKSKSNATVDEVKRQVGQCWSMPITKGSLKNVIPNSVVVVTCGILSNNAEVELNSSLDAFNKSNTKYIGRDELVHLIDQHYKELWAYQLPVLSRYLGSLKKWIEKKTLYEAVLQDGVDFIGVTCSRRLRAAEKLTQKDISKPKDILKVGSIAWLQGGMGSGKTFTVWHLCDVALSELHLSRKEKRKTTKIRIPVYLRATELLNFPDSENERLPWLHSIIQKYAPDITSGEITNWIKDFGTDLIIDEFELNPQATELENFKSFLLSMNQNVSVLLLSRFTDETKYPLSTKTDVWYLREINFASASKIISNAATKIGGHAPQAYKELVREGVLKKLPRTPLALNILRLVFEEHSTSLPNNTYEFFDMFFQIVLGRWEVGRETSRPFDYKQTRAFLQRVAYKMTCEKKVLIPTIDLETIAADVLSSAAEKQLSPKEYIFKIVGFGDICQVEGDLFSFKQRTYQEFLAGCELFQHHWNHDSIINNFTDVHWEESVIFASGAKGRDDDLLLKLPSKSVNNHFELFYKMKNIGLISQALYQSSQSSKEVAVAAGAQCAVDLRDSSELIDRIKLFAPTLPDVYITYMMMKLFGLFYGRSTLQTSIEACLEKSPIGRSSFYLVAGLANISNSHRQLDLEKVLRVLPTTPSTLESQAIGGFLREEILDNKESSFKKLVDSKKVRRLAKKTTAVLVKNKNTGPQPKFIERGKK